MLFQNFSNCYQFEKKHPFLYSFSGLCINVVQCFSASNNFLIELLYNFANSVVSLYVEEKITQVILICSLCFPERHVLPPAGLSRGLFAGGILKNSAYPSKSWNVLESFTWSTKIEQQHLYCTVKLYFFLINALRTFLLMYFGLYKYKSDYHDLFCNFLLVGS